MADDTAIKVSVRIRPLNARELGENQKEGFEFSEDSMLEKVRRTFFRGGVFRGGRFFMQRVFGGPRRDL